MLSLSPISVSPTLNILTFPLITQGFQHFCRLFPKAAAEIQASDTLEVKHLQSLSLSQHYEDQKMIHINVFLTVLYFI